MSAREVEAGNEFCANSGCEGQGPDYKASHGRAQQKAGGEEQK